MFGRFNRLLHNPTFISPEIKELVVFGNNSILFTSLDALQHHKRVSYPKITWVYPSFWLDRVHPDNAHLDWGQTIFGLPREVRNRFLLARPNYPDDKLIEWHEYQSMRQAALAGLAEFNNLTIHRGEPLEIDSLATGHDIRIKQNSQINTVRVAKDSFFYNWYQSPRLIQRVTSSHTEMYEMPRSEIADKVIIFGHGLSVVWLLRHFPKTRFINIKRENEQLPYLPANRDLDIQKEIASGRLVIYTDKQITVRTDVTGKHAILLSRNGKILHEAPIYAATGFVPSNILSDSSIPENRYLNMPVISSNGQMVFPNDAATLKVMQDKFVAPLNIPLGSLIHSYTHLMHVTENMLWTTEPMFFYKKSGYELFKQQAQKAGIDLHLDYFDELDNQISKLNDPLTPAQSEQLYLATFTKIYKSSASEVEIFKSFLSDYFASIKAVATTRLEEADNQTVSRPKP